MRALRNRVRVVAVSWLLCQAATLAAFVPQQCCTAHAALAATAQGDACHEAEPPKPEPGDACPMQHAGGAACPMHSGRAHDCCAMSNGCEGPGSQLANLLAFNVSPEPPVVVAISPRSVPAYLAPDDSPLHFVIRPLSPPPKA